MAESQRVVTGVEFALLLLLYALSLSAGNPLSLQFI